MGKYLAELLAIGNLALKYDAFVITDEVYEHIIYPPYHHVSMASLPGMFDHVITCNSLSKTYSITGWRLGYVIGSEEVISAAKKVHDFLTALESDVSGQYEFSHFLYNC